MANNGNYWQVWIEFLSGGYCYSMIDTMHNVKMKIIFLRINR